MRFVETHKPVCIRHRPCPGALRDTRQVNEALHARRAHAWSLGDVESHGAVQQHAFRPVSQEVCNNRLRIQRLSQWSISALGVCLARRLRLQIRII